MSVLIVGMLALGACGSDQAAGEPTGTTSPGAYLSGALHREGGIAGFDQMWTLEVDGSVLGPDGAVGYMSAAGMTMLADAADQAGFWTLQPNYLPADPCCDRFTYTVTLSNGVSTNTVATMDGAEAPDGLWSVIETFLGLVE